MPAPLNCRLVGTDSRGQSFILVRGVADTWQPAPMIVNAWPHLVLLRDVPQVDSLDIRVEEVARWRDGVLVGRDEPKVKRKGGFASMDPEKRRAIARKGGASVPAAKRSFSRDKDLAANAGRKGGESKSRNRKGGPRKAGPKPSRFGIV